MLFVPLLLMKLKILSYNIHKGFSLANWRFTLHEIRNAIRETGADICFLQEVVGFHELHSKKFDTWPSEAQFEFLADTVWDHYSYGKNAVFPSRHHGNAILSKFPILHSENTDISTNKFERRGLLHCILDLPGTGKKVHLYNTHLNLLDGSRQKQLKWIINKMRPVVEKEELVVLAGDFNDWTGKLTPPLTENLKLVECFYGNGGVHAKTFPSIYPLVSLDRVYFRNLQLLTQTVLKGSHWRDLSDHLPLLVEFRIH